MIRRLRTLELAIPVKERPTDDERISTTARSDREKPRRLVYKGKGGGSRESGEGGGKQVYRGQPGRHGRHCGEREREKESEWTIKECV